MKEHFVNWLDGELKERGWNQAELARRSLGVSRPTINNILNLKQTPTWDFCVSIARAFRIPPETVFGKAGLLPPLPAPLDDLSLRELVDLAKRLTTEERQELLEYALWRYRRQERNR